MSEGRGYQKEQQTQNSQGSILLASQNSKEVHVAGKESARGNNKDQVRQGLVHHDKDWL